MRSQLNHDLCNILILDEQGEILKPQLLTQDSYIVGRHYKCDIIIEEKAVSRFHCEINQHGSRYVVRDTNSTNGTFVNGDLITGSFLLKNGDKIGLGAPHPRLCFQDLDATSITDLNLLRYDEKNQAFFINRERLEFTPTEERLLLYLYRNAGELCTRPNCMEVAFKEFSELDEDLNNISLNRHIANIRRKLDAVDLGASSMIETDRGKGYRLILFYQSEH